MISVKIRLIASWLCLAIWSLSFFISQLFEVGLLAIVAFAALRSSLQHLNWRTLSLAARRTLVLFFICVVAFSIARAFQVFPTPVTDAGTITVRLAIIPFAIFCFYSDWRALQQASSVAA